MFINLVVTIQQLAILYTSFYLYIKLLLVYIQVDIISVEIAK